MTRDAVSRSKVIGQGHDWRT